MSIGTDHSHRVVPCRAVLCRAEPCRPTADKGCSINAPLPSPAIPGKGGPEPEHKYALPRPQLSAEQCTGHLSQIKYGTGLVSLKSATLLLKTTSHRPWLHIAERTSTVQITMWHRLLTTFRSFNLTVSPHLYT